eukprot:TRINITY_DN13172_c0_g1_i1.p1 TRINITY_DN13172_c0_g1~~TRINITY_DN13172_c0_g1_i1.p1  ORF type:complete len:232 (+),score=48.82 TRINITY_DN13172_c0_g1_i1:57-752(+)
MGTSSSTPRKVVVKKIDYAAAACSKFIENVMSGRDRCAISTFNSDYKLHMDFTSDEKRVVNSIHRLKQLPSGGTCLYDSIALAILQFTLQGDSSRPWIMIILTDGNDNESKRLKNDPGACGDLIRETFNKPASNFIFIVGVGRDVNLKALQTMASRGNFNVIPVENFELLEAVFAVIALRISNSISVSAARIQAGNEGLLWAQVRQQRSIVRQPMDIMFLVDVSGSMGDEV